MLVKKFKEDYIDKSMVELVKERNKILENIKNYEDKFIFNNPNYSEVMYSKPSPKTMYEINNEDLIMLTELIMEKNKIGNTDKCQNLIDEYVKKFGGFPHYLFMGADEEIIIQTIKNALNSGKEISTSESNIDY
ncbi:MAG: hypothetical protein E7166_00660 [Firmicutes bacterium]|nr:hypothetical protein [Bacillota bacterium]